MFLILFEDYDDAFDTREILPAPGNRLAESDRHWKVSAEEVETMKKR